MKEGVAAQSSAEIPSGGGVGSMAVVCRLWAWLSNQNDFGTSTTAP